MIVDEFDKDGHNPTTYSDYAEMRAAAEEIPFDDPPRDGCWNCIHFDWKHEACSAGWNNLDDDYYNPHTDDRNYEDWCEQHELDPEAKWEDVFGDD